jgi:hypothetical protein
MDTTLTPNNVGLCCDKMLRPFDQALRLFSYIYMLEINEFIFTNRQELTQLIVSRM